jgi:hypothetical protein
MKKKLIMLPVAALLVGGAQLAFSPVASAHNRAQIVLPNGECIVVGSLKSVTLPDGTNVDLRPETPQDEIGAAFAANQGQSRIEIGDCS